MKKIFAMTLLAALPLAAMAQYEEGSENYSIMLLKSNPPFTAN